MSSGASADDIETVTVTGDRVHLIDTAPDDTAFGIAKPLVDTPRAITVVSDTTLDRYGVDGVDGLTAVTPSAYTASYYGVEGAVNLRGTLAESYFRGFKRAENRGTYDTPLGDAAELEILRGPPSAIYGAGKVGGLVNFTPKGATPIIRPPIPMTSAGRRPRPTAAIPNATPPARSGRHWIWASRFRRGAWLWRDR